MSDAATPAPSHADPPTSIFRNRNFILLWCAYTSSALGDHLSEMALLDMQEATQRDDSTRIGAIILFAFMLPFFLFGPAMGWLADRLPRKWIMVAADLIRAVLMFSLAALFVLLFAAFDGTAWLLRPSTPDAHAIYSPWVYAIPLFLTGLFAAMFSPSRAAMLPTLIRVDQIVRGNGLMNAMGPIASIVSFVVGAHLVAAYGPAVNFRVDAATFLASAALILCIRPPKRSGSLHGSHRKGREGILQGLDYCRTHRRVIELILFTVVFWSAAGVVRSIIPALVGHVFGGGITDIGYYQATLGIGMLTGAALLAALGDALRSEIAISWSLIGAGLAAVWLALVSFLRIGQFSGGLGLFLLGLFGSAILVSAHALLQKIVPDCFRGRVFGVMDVASVGGLLAATGALGIPRWTGIDRFVPSLLILTGTALVACGIFATIVRLRRGRFSLSINFWKNLNEFYCRAWVRVERVGPCTIPAAGPVIVAANHRSPLDPFALIATCPNRFLSFLIAREYAEIPVFGRLVRMIECVAVNRTGVDTASVKAALRHLANGRCLGIFPEGRIRSDDEPPRLREGVGLLALRSGATVVPAYIWGIHNSPNILKPFMRRHRAKVRYGPPINLAAFDGRLRDRQAAREAAELIMTRIMALKPADA